MRHHCTEAVAADYSRLTPANQQAVCRALEARAAGWRPIHEDRAANPEQKPAGALYLMACGPRLAWQLRGGELDKRLQELLEMMEGMKSADD